LFATSLQQEEISMAAAKKKALGLSKGMRTHVPSAEVIVQKFQEARLMTSGKARGQQAQRNRMLSGFAQLLASRPSGNRHINRLVVDWTRVVEIHYGVGSDLPLAADGRALFEHVVKAFLPPEVMTAAMEAYDALFRD
jgi:hypothetical protein